MLSGDSGLNLDRSGYGQDISMWQSADGSSRKNVYSAGALGRSDLHILLQNSVGRCMLLAVSCSRE